MRVAAMASWLAAREKVVAGNCIAELLLGESVQIGGCTVVCYTCEWRMGLRYVPGQVSGHVFVFGMLIG